MILDGFYWISIQHVRLIGSALLRIEPRLFHFLFGCEMQTKIFCKQDPDVKN